MAGSDALGPGAALGGAGIARQPRLDGGEQGRQRRRRVGGDRQVHRGQRLEGVGPATEGVVVERDRDDAGALVQQTDLPRAAIGVAQRAQKAGDLEGEHHVGLAHDLVAGAGHVERVAGGHARPPLRLAGQVDQRGAEPLGQARERRRDRRPSPERLRHDEREARLDQQLRRLLQRAGVGVRRRRRREARHVRDGDAALEWLLLQPSVQAHVDRPRRRGLGDAPRAQEGFRNRGDAGRLVVELHVVADLRPLHERGVDPVDPRPAAGGVHRPAGAQHQDRRAIAERVEDRHAGVLEPDDVVHHLRHRPALGLRVAVGQADGDLLVGGEHELRRPVAAVVHERVVQAAKGRAGVQRHVLDADRPQEVHDEIRAVPRCRRHVRASGS